jgi:hypothetical protein
MSDPIKPTTDELRAAWLRGALPLRFLGWSFDKALTIPTVRWALEKSALAHRHTHHLPAQPGLF